jgi:hypothetical protein
VKPKPTIEQQRDAALKAAIKQMVRGLIKMEDTINAPINYYDSNGCLIVGHNLVGKIHLSY